MASKLFSKRVIFIIGISVSALCLWFAFRNMHWSDLWSSLRQVSLWHFFLGILLTNIHNFVLAKRWQLLLKPLGPVRFFQAFWSLRIAFFFNATLPARLGEPFRIFFIHRTTGISPSRTVGAMVADRLMDFLTLVVLIYFSAFVLGMRESLWSGVSVIVFLLFGAALLWSLTRLPRSSKHAWLNRVFEIRTLVFEGFATLRSRKMIGTTALLSILGWALEASIVLCFAYGVGFEISVFKALMVVGAVNVAISIPSTPGHLGTFELGAITMLKFFAMPLSQAGSVAILYHMVQLLTTLVIGAIGYYFYFLKLTSSRVTHRN